MRAKRPPLLPAFEPGDPPDQRIKGWTVTKLERIGPLQEAADRQTWHLYALAFVQKPNTTSRRHRLQFGSHSQHRGSRPTGDQAEALFAAAEEDLLESLKQAGCLTFRGELVNRIRRKLAAHTHNP